MLGVTEENRPSLELRINRTNKVKKPGEKKKRERPFTEHPEYSPRFHKPLVGLCNHGDGCTTVVHEGDLFCLPGDLWKCNGTGLSGLGRKDTSTGWHRDAERYLGWRQWLSR